MHLNKECQTTETASTIRTSAPDSAASRLLSSATALKPPHLALVGQTVERLEGITAGDKEIVSTQRGALSALLRFGMTHGQRASPFARWPVYPGAYLLFAVSSRHPGCSGCKRVRRNRALGFGGRPVDSIDGFLRHGGCLYRHGYSLVVVDG